MGWMKCSDLNDNDMLGRIEQERWILRYLESKKVDFTPKIIIDQFICEKEGFKGVIMTDCGDPLDPSDPLSKEYMEKARSLSEKLISLKILWDDYDERNVLKKGEKLFLIDFEGSSWDSRKHKKPSFPPTQFLSVL